jgi:hypothetical protein
MVSGDVQQQVSYQDEDKAGRKPHQNDCVSSDSLQSQESAHSLHTTHDADGEPLSEFAMPKVEDAAATGMGAKRLAQSKDTNARKRRGKMSIDGEANEEESNMPSFACPFFRKYPLFNMECACRRLTRIRDVRQHLSRHHHLIACSICQETLSSYTELTDHLASRSCSRREPQPTITEVSVSGDIIQKLKDCNYRGKTSEGQWYEIWDTLFGDKSKPRGTHFLGAFTQETTNIIKDIMRDVWKSTAREVIESYVAEKQTTPTVLLRDLEEVLATLVDKLQVQVENRMQNPASCGSDCTSSISSESLSSLSTTDLRAPHTIQNERLTSCQSSWMHSDDGISHRNTRRASGASTMSMNRFHDSFAGYTATSLEDQMQAICPNILDLCFKEEPLRFNKEEAEHSKMYIYPECISDNDIWGSLG